MAVRAEFIRVSWVWGRDGHEILLFLLATPTVQDYAECNRQIIVREILKGMKWKAVEQFSVAHNYLDAFEVLRKGAIAAEKGARVIIPANMRDGMILGMGLGNEDWNCSAPHGSGRRMKREDVKSRYTVSDFKKEMKGIYSSCVWADTLDEASFAYRSITEIAEQIGDTLQITEILRPVYNYKAGSKEAPCRGDGDRDSCTEAKD